MYGGSDGGGKRADMAKSWRKKRLCERRLEKKIVGDLDRENEVGTNIVSDNILPRVHAKRVRLELCLFHNLEAKKG